MKKIVLILLFSLACQLNYANSNDPLLNKAKELSLKENYSEDEIKEQNITAEFLLNDLDNRIDNLSNIGKIVFTRWVESFVK